MWKPSAVLLAAALAGCGGVGGAAPAAAGRAGSTPAFLTDPSRLEAMGLAVRWKAGLRDARPLQLHLGERSCYVESAAHEIHALDRASGFYKWILPLRGALQVPPGESILPPDRQGEGRDTAYFIGGQVLLAVDIDDPSRTGAESGRQLWAEPLPFRPVTPLVATDHYLAVGAADDAVHVYKLRESDPDNPRIVRRLHLKSWKYDTGGELRGAPVLPRDEPDQIIAASAAGVVVSRSLRTGEERWRYPYHGNMGGVLSGLAYDLAYPTATRDWRAKPEHTLYVGALDHALDILDPGNEGALLSRVLLTDGIEERPLVTSRALPGNPPDWTMLREIFCVARDGRLFAFRVRDAHVAQRDGAGQPLTRDIGGRPQPVWVPENHDADDVTGGEVEAEAEAPAPSPAGEEPSGEAPPAARPLSRLLPIQWTVRELWTAKDVARIICRSRAGLYVLTRDHRLRLLDEEGRERWSEPLDGVMALPSSDVNPFFETPALYLMDKAGLVWCLEEK